LSPPISAPVDRRFEAVLDAFVVFFGLWTLYGNLLVFGGASFNLLLLLSPLPLAGTVWLWRWLRRVPAPGPVAEAERPSRVPVTYKLLAAAAILAIYTWTQQLWLLWILGVVFLAGCVIDHPRRAETAAADRRFTRLDLVLLTLSLVAALSCTAFVHRYDADDAYYMSVPVALLDHPDRPLLAADTMHGEPGLPLLGPHYRTVSYELLIGAVSFVTRLDHRVPYYVLFPLLFAGMLIVACWLPLRLLSPRTASLGVLAVCLVTLVWGDVHHAYGNFGFVRLFQGKAVLASICAPAILYYGLRYSARGDRASWTRLALAQMAMVGFSASGVVIAPLLAGLVLLGSWRPDRRSTRILLIGLAASAIPVLEAAIVALQVRDFGAIVSPLDDTSTARSLELVLGQGPRARLALFGLLAAAAVSAATPRHRGIAGYLLAAFALLLSPWSGDLISLAEETFAWRSLWAIPFPLILGIGVARLAGQEPVRSGPRPGLAGALAFVLAFALVPGRPTWTAENKARFRVAAFRVGDGWPAAARAVEVTPAGGTVLAPRRTAMWITGFRGHPKLVGVRQDYLDIVVGKVHGAEEARARRTLMEFVHGKRGGAAWLEMAEAIDRRAIDTVVTHPDLTARGGEPFFAELARRGYAREDVDNGYVVWTRARP
jgi:hypothetical protein